MIGDSVTLHYFARKNCELTVLSEDFNTQFFGFVLPKGEGHLALREKISEAIIKFGEEGELDNLYDKWWPRNKSVLVVELWKVS